MKKGFTLVEIVITIVIWSILIIPLAMIVKEHILGTVAAADIARAYNLARLEMSKVNNLNYTDATLADGYNNTTSNYEGCGYDLNRAVNYVAGSGSNLKKVAVTVYEPGATRQLASLVTYAANVAFGAGSGGLPAVGGQSDYLVISDGQISGKKLHKVTLQNTSATDTITISGVIVSWINSNPRHPAALTTVSINGVTNWSGTQPVSGSTITLTIPFTLGVNATYDKSGEFNFSDQINSVTLTFIMSDGSTAPSVTW